MAKNWIDDHFLLKTEAARRLYHETAAALPIIDYHCHLDAKELAADRHFENIAQLWVTGDPYKHRAMRITGVPEAEITGPATDRAKFDHWARTLPRTLGNPLHHWSALELLRYFGVDEPLTSESAPRVWEACNARLREPGFTARGLLSQRQVACVCTSDRLLDDLSGPAILATSGFGTRVLPSLRSDDIVAVETTGYGDWLKQLGLATGVTVDSYEAFRGAVGKRLDAFDALDCKLADHGLDDFAYLPTSDEATAALFKQRLSGLLASATDTIRLRSGLLRFLGVEYGRRGWLLQVHLGAQRFTSSRLRKQVGPAGGFACVGKANDIPSVCVWLDELEQAEALPRTILYPLNPVDFPALATLAGSFPGDGVVAKVQLGPAWWFNDHAWGMRAQLDAIANHGILSIFIGMTTDSRSLLSMARHEYFRRVLCGWIGEQIEAGMLPDDHAALSGLVRDIAYENARRFLRL